MKKLAILITASLILATACTPKEGIEVRDAWVRTAAQGENGAVYFVIHNYSAEDNSIIGVSSDVADSVEIHESTMNDDVMEMHMVHSVPLPSGEVVEFGPGGLHIMLVNLNQELTIGGTIELTLHFENSADVLVTTHIMAGPEHDDD